MTKNKEVKMVKCPGCSLELPEDDPRAQMRHMDEAHPDIIAQRLKEAGIPYNVTIRIR